VPTPGPCMLIPLRVVGLSAKDPRLYLSSQPTSREGTSRHPLRPGRTAGKLTTARLPTYGYNGRLEVSLVSYLPDGAVRLDVCKGQFKSTSTIHGISAIGEMQRTIQMASRKRQVGNPDSASAPSWFARKQPGDHGPENGPPRGPDPPRGVKNHET
jgi:hypothetical protein